MQEPRRFSLRRLAALPVLLITCSAILSGQESRGSISGRVLDETMATIPAAEVSIVNQATNVTVKVTTNEQGLYSAPFLPPGQYSLTVRKDGFTQASQPNVILQTQDRLTLDFVLKPGSVSDSITVSAESPMLQTAAADFGQVVNKGFVDRLPVVGTNPLGLSDMAPGVVPNSPDTNVSNYNSSYVQVNGSSGRGNQMTIDGAPVEIPRMSGVSYVIPMAEMLEEMKVVTAMFDAAQGRTNGGSILLTTRSGTNQYRGVAYYHFRDERFNANSWTNNYRGQPRGQQNFWVGGVTFGGPIRKDRSFFMAGIEKEKNLGNTNFRFRVPTVAERQGDFSQVLSPSGRPLQIYDPLTTMLDSNGRFISRNPFPGARIPSSRIYPVARGLMSQYPEPNYLDLPNQLGQLNYMTGVTQQIPNLNLQTRVDQVLNDKHRLYFRYARNHGIAGKYDRAPIPGFAADSNANTDDRMAHHFVVEETAMLTPTILASFRGGFNRFKQHTYGAGDRMDPALLNLPDTLKGILYSGGDSGTGWPRLDINDGNVPSVGPMFRSSVNNVLTFTNNYSTLRGKHNLRWGVDYRNTRWFENNPGNTQNGRFTFDKNLTRATDDGSSNTTSGSGLASLLLDLPTGGSVARNPAMAAQSHYTGLYVQDDYRISPKLTLSLGLRYDIETPLTDRYDRFAFGFDKQADLGINIPGVGPLAGGLEFVGISGLPRRQGWTDTNNFGPRISAAYMLTNKTVIRAGWGLFFQGLTNNLSTAAPTSVATFNWNTNYVGSPDGYRTVMPGVSLSNPFPNGFEPITGSSLGLRSQLGSSVSYVNPDRYLPTVQQMQISIQRELPWKSLIDVAYVGVRYDGLYRDYNLNDVPDAYRTQDNSTQNPFYRLLPPTSSRGSTATIPANQLKTMFPQYTSVTEMTTNGPWGRYDGLQMRWEKRLSHGVQVVANYTWSKNMYYDPQSLVNDRFYTSVTDNDRTHIARLFLTADLPFGKHRSWGTTWATWLDQVAGNWAVTWVTRYRSGSALGLSGPNGRPVPLANPATGASVRDCLGDPVGPMPTNPCLDINKVVPLASRFDITPEPPRYAWLRGPGYGDHDVVLFKTFPITERVKFEIRSEVNNVFNTPQWGDPRTDVANPRTFGTINTGGNQRSVRFTGRLLF